MIRCKEYQILAKYCNIDLGKLVTENLEKGWELYGSPFVINRYIGQAMVRRAKDD